MATKADKRKRWAGDRKGALRRIRARLERLATPRFDMFVIATMTGGAGFVASWGLLQFDVASLALRYPLSVLAAWVVFLFLLWCWLHVRGEEPEVDFVDTHGSYASPRSDGGWEPLDAGSASLDDGGALDVPDAGGLDEAVFVVLVLAVLFGVFWIVASVVWSAPILFAEILLDAGLAGGLYGRLRKIEPGNWIETALKRTWKPFLGIAVLLSLAGFAMQAYAPEAVSLGGVIERLGQ